MKNNLVLNLLKDRFSETGAIEFESLPKLLEKNYEEHADTNIWSAKKVFTKIGEFYIAPENQIEKEVIDSEILLSQVYNEMGFDAPIYFPVKRNRHVTVMCDDILSNKIEIAEKYHKSCAPDVKSDYKTLRHLFRNGDLKKGFVPRFFSRDCLKRRIELELLDAAMNVSTRDFNQIAYKKSTFGKAIDVIPLSNGISGYNFLKEKKRTLTEPVYLSEFSENFQTVEGLAKSYAQNSQVKEYFSEEDMTNFLNRLQKLDIEKIAQDIKDNINYEIDSNYVKFVEKNKELVFDTLHDEIYKNNAKNADLAWVKICKNVGETYNNSQKASNTKKEDELEK